MQASQLISPKRRALPRIPADVFCSEHDDNSERHAMILDFSENGLRVQRPIGGPRTRQVQLEFGIPGIDEIIWARGEICFDEVWQVPAIEPGGLSGILRTSGIRLITSAARHQRMLREYVTETWRQLQAPADPEQTEWLMRASCYMRG